MACSFQINAPALKYYIFARCVNAGPSTYLAARLSRIIQYAIKCAATRAKIEWQIKGRPANACQRILVNSREIESNGRRDTVGTIGELY